MSHKNNFTALRWFAAGLVLYGHSFVFLGLPEPTFLGWVPMGPLGVYIFFAISGYLVAQSWDSDPHCLRFLQRRALRIFPGLIVCTLLSVFLLGPIFTTLPLSNYFKDLHTWKYFTNILLYITFYLPGVFATNLFPNAVNGSLWSLPAEFSMYLLLALFGLFRIPKTGWVILALLLMYFSKFWATRSTEMLVVYRTDLRQVVICGVYFWVGVLYFRYKISRYISITSVIFSIVLWLALTRWIELFVIASWFILPFLALAFGLATNSWFSRMSRLDYSYGIYIYAFPIQQAVVSLEPNMPLLQYLLLSTIFTLVFAALSWHWVEKPALALKPRSGQKPMNFEKSP